MTLIPHLGNCRYAVIRLPLVNAKPGVPLVIKPMTPRSLLQRPAYYPLHYGTDYFCLSEVQLHLLSSACCYRL